MAATLQTYLLWWIAIKAVCRLSLNIKRDERNNKIWQMTRISNISQDMKCQYVYDAIDHYSYSNQINKKRRTNEWTRNINENAQLSLWKESCQHSFFPYRELKKSQIKRSMCYYWQMDWWWVHIYIWKKN